LNDENVFTTHILVQLNADLAVRKLANARIAKRKADVLRDCVCESGVGVATEDHQIICHE
jgi:hypothetical protein